ncbi:hypothetical protein EG832_19450, partial [bacterium]|nr:hypothetical protein [bacterium]
ALLSYLVRNKITSFVATHYPELKAFAHNTPGIINASMEFNLQTLKPTYHLMVGLPGRSNALAISERLGLPLEIVEDARSLVDPTELRAEDLLNEIHRQRGIARKERKNAEKARIQARRVERELNERLAKVEQERLIILETARKAAEDQTRQLGEELEVIRKELTRAKLPLDTIKNITEKVEEIEEDVSLPILPNRKKTIDSRKPLSIGEKIMVRTLGMKGVLTAIGEEDAEAQLGNLRVRVSFDDILRAGEEDDQSTENESGQPKISARARKALSIMSENPSKPSILHVSPGMELDIRGEMSEDAMDKMDRFIESAYLSGMPFVRIIHGKGTGKLRQVVREALSKSSFVDRWESGTDREGGDGVTVAFM